MVVNNTASDHDFARQLFRKSLFEMFSGRSVAESRDDLKSATGTFPKIGAPQLVRFPHQHGFDNDHTVDFRLELGFAINAD